MRSCSLTRVEASTRVTPGPRAGIVAVEVEGVAAGVRVVSLKFGSMVRLGQGRLDLAAVHPFATRTGWLEPLSLSGRLNQVFGHATGVGAV